MSNLQQVVEVVHQYPQAHPAGIYNLSSKYSGNENQYKLSFTIAL